MPRPGTAKTAKDASLPPHPKSLSLLFDIPPQNILISQEHISMASAIYPTGLSSPSYSTRNSREHLLPKSQRPRSLRASHVRTARALQLQLAASKSAAGAIEQKRSHGIGGAGNISTQVFFGFVFLPCSFAIVLFYFELVYKAGKNKTCISVAILNNFCLGRPSEVIYPIKLNADGTKKRGMAWSAKSIAPGLNQNGKRPALLGFFGKKDSLGSKASPARVVEQRPVMAQEESDARKGTIK